MGVGDGQELEVHGEKILLGLGNKCFLVLRKSWEIPWCLGHSLEYSFYSISTAKNPESSVPNGSIWEIATSSPG